MTTIQLTTYNVGIHFGCIGVASVNGRTVETDVLPFGHGSSARQRAYDAAIRGGLIREIGEAHNQRGIAAARQAGATVLLDRWVVVAANDPRPDSLIATAIELKLQG